MKTKGLVTEGGKSKPSKPLRIYPLDHYEKLCMDFFFQMETLKKELRFI